MFFFMMEMCYHLSDELNFMNQTLTKQTGSKRRNAKALFLSTNK